MQLGMESINVRLFQAVYMQKKKKVINPTVVIWKDMNSCKGEDTLLMTKSLT